MRATMRRQGHQRSEVAGLLAVVLAVGCSQEPPMLLTLRDHELAANETLPDRIHTSAISEARFRVRFFIRLNQ